MGNRQTVIAQALKLPVDDRLAVVDALYESLEGPVDPDAQQAWSDEIARRLSEIRSGQATFIPWEQARRQILGEPSDGAALGSYTLA